MRIALASLSYLITVFALVLLTVRVRQLIGIYRKGQADPTRSNDQGARFKNMLKEVLGHTKMLNFTATGIAHWFVMIGFGALFGTLVTAYGQVINPEFALPLIGHWVVYELFAEFIAMATGVGIVTLIGIRQVTRFRMLNRFAGSGMGKAYYVEATILAIVFCVIALRGLEGALLGKESWNWHFAISWPAVLAFQGMSDAAIENAIVWVATAKIVISMAWFIVIASNLTMGIAWHRFLAFFNIFYKRNSDGSNSLGALPEMLSHGKPVNFEDPAEDDVFGLGNRADISWKGLLDMTSCTECGRCQSQCPAWHTDKPLSPKLLIMAMRDHAMAKVVETEAIVGENSPISLDVLWSCTMCGACVNECPVDIEHVDHIVNMRRFQVLVESEFPSELGGVPISKIAKVGLLSVISRFVLLKAYCQMKLSICSGLVALVPMKNAPRKQPRRWPNFSTWQALTSQSLESARHVPEILRVVLAMNFFTKSCHVKISKHLMKYLQGVQRVRRRLLLPALTALQQSVAIMHKVVLNLRCCTTLNCLIL
jgi:ferredoxin